MTILYSDVEPLSKYSSVMLHLSPATRILNENPETWVWFCILEINIVVENLKNMSKQCKKTNYKLRGSGNRLLTVNCMWGHT